MQLSCVNSFLATFPSAVELCYAIAVAYLRYPSALRRAKSGCSFHWLRECRRWLQFEVSDGAFEGLTLLDA